MIVYQKGEKLKWKGQLLVTSDCFISYIFQSCQMQVCKMYEIDTATAGRCLNDIGKKECMYLLQVTKNLLNCNRYKHFCKYIFLYSRNDNKRTFHSISPLPTIYLLHTLSVMYYINRMDRARCTHIDVTYSFADKLRLSY